MNEYYEDKILKNKNYINIYEIRKFFNYFNSFCLAISSYIFEYSQYPDKS